MMRAVVVLLVWLFLTTPLFAQHEKLSLDGVSIGMSASEVLAVLGRPKFLNEESGLIVLSYPAPTKRPQPTTVWFRAGRVVYASGYTLESEGEPLFLYGMMGEILADEFGPSEPLCDFGRWWPELGLVLAGSNAIWPFKELSAPLGLRSLDYPKDWSEPAPGLLRSNFEPWIDDETTTWMVDDISLGMAEEQARKLAGDLDVVYRGGYVQAIRNPESAIFSHKIGVRDVSLLFDLGQAPQVFGQGSPISPPSNGWFAPSASGKVRLRHGKVVEIRLKLQADAIFEALTKSDSP